MRVPALTEREWQDKVAALQRWIRKFAAYQRGDASVRRVAVKKSRSFRVKSRAAHMRYIIVDPKKRR